MIRKIELFCEDQDLKGMFLERELGADSYSVEYSELFPMKGFLVVSEAVCSDGVFKDLGKRLSIPQSFDRFIPGSDMFIEENRKKARIQVNISFWFDGGINMNNVDILLKILRKELKTNIKVEYHATPDNVVHGVVVKFNRNPEKLRGFIG